MEERGINEGKKGERINGSKERRKEGRKNSNTDSAQNNAAKSMKNWTRC